jgi:hypothetical protein
MENLRKKNSKKKLILCVYTLTAALPNFCVVSNLLRLEYGRQAPRRFTIILNRHSMESYHCSSSLRELQDLINVIFTF